MKVLANWDEQYPALFIDFEDDDMDQYTRTVMSRHGVEIPEDMARRWRETRDAWRALDGEVRAFFGREKDT